MNTKIISFVIGLIVLITINFKVSIESNQNTTLMDLRFTSNASNAEASIVSGYDETDHMCTCGASVMICKPGSDVCHVWSQTPCSLVC